MKKNEMGRGHVRNNVEGRGGACTGFGGET